MDKVLPMEGGIGVISVYLIVPQYFPSSPPLLVLKFSQSVSSQFASTSVFFDILFSLRKSNLDKRLYMATSSVLSVLCLPLCLLFHGGLVPPTVIPSPLEWSFLDC